MSTAAPLPAAAAAAARHVIEWQRDGVRLRAEEPHEAEIAESAPALAAFYNDPYNRAMMANTTDLSATDVVEVWAEMRAAGGRPFLLFVDGALAGDADLRGVEADRAEFAFMVGPRASQGRGLGTAFGVMVAAFAFRALGVARLYASILPHNGASLRAFEKMGYDVDESDDARACADEDDDVTVSIGRDAFEARHAEALRIIRIEERP